MKKSTQIAIGGVCSAICLTLLLLTGMIPFSSYVFPGIAGVLLAVVARETSMKTAIPIYIATSLLSLVLVTDRSAALIFILVLGYYPMARPYFFALRSRALCFFCRFLLLNAGCLVFALLTYLFLQPDERLLQNFRYGIALFWLFVMATMLLYDYTLGRLAFLYTCVLRRRLFPGSRRGDP